MLKAIILVLISITFMGCDKAESVDAESKTLMIHGLYLGMSIDDVPAVLKKKLPGYAVSGVEKAGEGTYRVVVGDNTAFVLADRDKKVDTIVFIFAVDDFFDSAGLDPKTFTREFINAYDLPDMQLVDENWSYSSDEGFKVSIHSKYKFLRIEKTAGPGGRK